MKCPKCKKEIPAEYIAGELGKIKSKKKSESSAANGKKGGRPVGSKNKKVEGK